MCYFAFFFKVKLDFKFYEIITLFVYKMSSIGT